jgi:hypothetical protein
MVSDDNIDQYGKLRKMENGMCNGGKIISFLA